MAHRAPASSVSKVAPPGLWDGARTQRPQSGPIRAGLAMSFILVGVRWAPGPWGPRCQLALFTFALGGSAVEVALAVAVAVSNAAAAAAAANNTTADFKLPSTNRRAPITEGPSSRDL